MVRNKGSESVEEIDKIYKTQDTRSQSKQNPSSARGSNESEEKKDEEVTGTKRPASKANTEQEIELTEEPEAKRLRESESTSMNDAQNIEVHEFYSVPRIAPETIGKYVSKSVSFDINTNDSDGKAWDFTKASMRQKPREYVNKHRPLFIIGSPPCDQWSIMQNLNKGKTSPEEVQKTLIEARIHLAFCAELDKMQIDSGRYYLHEHPTSASSWNEPCMQDIIKDPEHFTARIHMCAYEMKIPDKHGNEYIYKPTQFITNSPLVAARLERKCDQSHQRAQLQGSRTKQAALYQNKLIDAVTKGINDQVKADRYDLNLVASIEIPKGYNIPDELKQIQSNAAQCHEDAPIDEYAVDDVSGAFLDPKMVRNARKDEIEYVRSMKLYTKVSISSACLKSASNSILFLYI